MTLPSDRRTAQRFPWVLQVSYLDAEEVADFTENLSESGLFIRTERPFAPGERTQLQLSFPPLLEPLVLEVVVVWRRPDTPGLPAGIAVKVPDDRPEERAKLTRLLRMGGTRQAAARAGSFRILVVEDNPLMARLYSGALEEGLSHAPGVAVETAPDGRKALERLLRAPAVDLVITDRFMPFMDGLTLLMRMRAEPRLRAVPVVMISADNSPEAAQKALALGTTVYLRKPVDVLDVVRTTEGLLLKGR